MAMEVEDGGGMTENIEQRKKKKQGATAALYNHKVGGRVFKI